MLLAHTIRLAKLDCGEHFAWTVSRQFVEWYVFPFDVSIKETV